MGEQIRLLMVTLNLKEEKRFEKRQDYIEWMEKQSSRFIPLTNVFDNHLRRLIESNWRITSSDVEYGASHNRLVEAYMRTLSSLYVQGMTYSARRVSGNIDQFIKDGYCTFKPEHRRKIEEASREPNWRNEVFGARPDWGDDDYFMAYFYKDEQVGILYRDILLRHDKEVDEVNTKIQQKMEMMEAGPLYPPSKYFRDINLDTAL